MKLIDNLKQDLKDSETDRAAAHAAIDAEYDAIKGQITNSIINLTSFFSPTTPSPVVEVVSLIIPATPVSGS
jgi:hypothetical protein